MQNFTQRGKGSYAFRHVGLLSESTNTLSCRDGFCLVIYNNTIVLVTFAAQHHTFSVKKKGTLTLQRGHYALDKNDIVFWCVFGMWHKRPDKQCVTTLFTGKQDTSSHRTWTEGGLLDLRGFPLQRRTRPALTAVSRGLALLSTWLKCFKLTNLVQ